MLILKMIGKLLPVPVWIVTVVVTAVVSLAVNILGFARVIALILTGYVILIAGVSVEVVFETLRDKIKHMIFA